MQRAFAVNDLVVRERQHEIFVVMIEHRERQVVLMIFAVDRLVLEITERVVHPAHVPFEREAESADVGRTRHLRPGGGFLGDGHHAGKFRVRDVIEFLQKLDRLQIFAAAKLVRNPLAFLARIIEIKHRGDGVHAQAVNVKAFAPEQRVGDEKIGNLVAGQN